MKALGWAVALVAAALAVFLVMRDPEVAPEETPELVRPEEKTSPSAEQAALRGRTDASPPTTPGTSPETEAAGAGLVVIGTLHDPEGAPAAGARLSIEVGEAGHFDAVADGEGRFRTTLAVDAPDRYLPATLRATLGDAASLYHAFGVPPKAFRAEEPYDLGTIDMKRATPLEVQVVFTAGATPPATVWVVGSGWWGGDPSSFAEAETDAEGRTRFERVPHGAWRVIATAEGAGRGEAFLSLPRPEGPEVEIVLPPERVVKIVVTDRKSQAPIADARVTLHETVRSPQGNFSSPCFQPREIRPTDERGTTAIRGLPPEGWFQVSVEAEGYPRIARRTSADGLGWARIPAEAAEVAVTLAKGRTIRWPIAAGEVPIPADGTRVTLTPSPGSGIDEVPADGIVADGHLEVAGCGPLYFHALAALPDGALASLYARDTEDVGPEIRFTRPRRILVTLTHPDGEPAVGYYVKTANQGNNPLAEPTPVDEEGRATIEGLHAEPDRRTLVEVRISQDAQPWGGFPIATVDLSEGDREVAGIVPRVRPVTVVIRRQGEVGLPAGIPVTTYVMGPRPGLFVAVSGSVATGENVDLETGEVHLDWQPAPGEREGHLNVSLAGYVPYHEAFPVPAGEDPLHFEVDLQPAGAIDVRVKAPEDGRTRINLQRWDAEQEAWQEVHLAQMAMGGYARPDANGDVRLEPLEAGRYRVIDSMNEAASGALEIRAGGEPARVVLDVSKSGFVRGRVEVPEGYAAASVRVMAEGLEGFANRWSAYGQAGPRGAFATCQDTGEFWLRVPGDRVVTLRPVATGLEPAAEGGTLKVREPREGVVLKLVPGRVARVAFSRPLGRREYRYPGRPLELVVRLYRGAATGSAAATLQGELDEEGRTLAFSGFEPGTWTVWIDADPFAPVVLENVVLGDDEIDLGEVQVHDGASVVVAIVLPADQDMPRMYAWVSKEGEPTYLRRADGASGSTLTVRGLGPGTFRVQVGSHMGRGPRLDETVEVDGKEEVRLTLDATR